MEVRAISWNLFHGRDRAPDPALHTWRSRLLRTTERGTTHAQVNLDLFAQFASVLRESSWDVALLQECPPRWAEKLATACEAEPHLVLTSRNLPPPLRGAQWAAGRLNPDLLASWEGGCNLTLVRGRQRGSAVSERRELTLTRWPETRRMAFTRLRSGFCVANLHASEDREAAERDVGRAARVAHEWAGAGPLLFGGDLNLRPASSPASFEALLRRYGLGGPTAEDAIDHLLARGADVVEAPARWPAERRERADPTAPTTESGPPIRLSDHAPVEACFALEASAG